MHTAVLAEENATLKATLAQRDARIERLEFDLAQLKDIDSLLPHNWMAVGA